MLGVAQQVKGKSSPVLVVLLLTPKYAVPCPSYSLPLCIKLQVNSFIYHVYKQILILGACTQELETCPIECALIRAAPAIYLCCLFFSAMNEFRKASLHVFCDRN